MTLKRLSGFVEKGWGSEFIWASNDLYCGKLLQFNRFAQFSMHFHHKKTETWLVLEGVFKVVWIDTNNASTRETILTKNDVWHNEPLVPHRLICLEKGTIVEVSTPDSIEDNYRIMAGDSQKKG